MNDNKTSLLSQAEVATGLKIVKIADAAQLSDLLDRGLAQLYSDVFAEPPYLEKFSLQDSRQVFEEYLSMKGILFVAVDPQTGVAAAFSVAVPLTAEPDIAKRVEKNITPEKAIYFADAGVVKDMRRRDISVLMKGLVIDEARAQGYSQAVSRTSMESYKQISAFNKIGGGILSGIFQDVASKRLDGDVSTDRRVFYGYDLKTLEADAQKRGRIDNVTIFRRDGKDTAYVRDFTVWMERPALSDWIKDAYPGISRVKYGRPGTGLRDRLKKLFNRKVKSPGKQVFKGGLYLSDSTCPDSLKVGVYTPMWF